MRFTVKWSTLGITLLAMGLALGMAGCTTNPGDDDDDDGATDSPTPTQGPDATTPPGGDDDDDGLTVEDIQDASSAQHPGEGTIVELPGLVVTSPMIYASSSSTVLDGFWAEEKDGGPYSGIYIYAKGFTVEVKPGDEIDVKGEYKEFYDKSEIVASEVNITGTAAQPEPELVTTKQVATGGTDTEAYESVLVEIVDVEITTADLGYGSFGVTPTDGSGPELIVSPTFDSYYAFEPTAGFKFSSMVGILDYSYNEFRLLPRSCDDLVDGDGNPACAEKVCPTSAVKISDIQDRAKAGAVPEGCTVRVENVVLTTQQFTSSKQPAFYVQDPEGGTYSGLFVFAKGLTLTGLEAGSEVTVEGVYKEYYGMTQIEATLVTASGEKVTVPAPVVLLPSDINTDGKLAEAYEGVLVSVEDVKTTKAQVLGTDSQDHGDFAVATEAELTKELIVGWQMQPAFNCPAGTTGCTDQRAVGQLFDSITGVMAYSYDEFRLQPRTAADIVLASK